MPRLSMQLLLSSPERTYILLVSCIIKPPYLESFHISLALDWVWQSVCLVVVATRLGA
jgi:hypothetical protein